MKKEEQFMNIDNARTPAQIANMERIAHDGVCPFCPEHLKKYHEPPIVKEGEYWLVTPNMYPYEHTLHHFLFIAKEHLTNSNDLSLAAWSELQELSKWLIATYEISSGTLLMRSGDMKKTGASVLHLHAQFVVGSDSSKPVVTRVG
jgi:diadenosine tetraphosphate (Ap4A) HIT family hydrolase